MRYVSQLHIFLSVHQPFLSNVTSIRCRPSTTLLTCYTCLLHNPNIRLPKSSCHQNQAVASSRSRKYLPGRHLGSASCPPPSSNATFFVSVSPTAAQTALCAETSQRENPPFDLMSTYVTLSPSLASPVLICCSHLPQSE